MRGQHARRRAAHLHLCPERRHRPYISALAGKGVDHALADDPGFAQGLNVKAGRVVHKAAAHSLGMD